jgi:MFS family permease
LSSLATKSEKSLSKVINYNFLGTIVGLVGLSLLVWHATSHYWGIFMKSLLIFAIAFVIMLIVAEIYYLIKLLKIDFSKSVIHNIDAFQHYNVVNKRMLLISYLGVAIILISVVIYAISAYNLAAWHWFVIAGTLVVGVAAAWWEYKQMYRKNIDSILRSLEELKELDED